MSVLSEESKRCSCRIIPDRRCALIICGGKEVLIFYRIGLFLSKNHGFRPEFNGLSLSLDVPRVSDVNYFSRTGILIVADHEGATSTLFRDARALRIPFRSTYTSGQNRLPMVDLHDISKVNELL